MKRRILVMVVLLGLFGCTPKVKENDNDIIKDVEIPIIEKLQIDSGSITVEAKDNVGIVGYLVTISDAQPELSDEGWQSSNLFTINRSGRFFFWAKDKEGNVSVASENAFYSIINALPFVMEIKVFDSGLLAAEDRDSVLWGYVGLDGVFVIAPQYNAADTFMENGLATVEINDQHLVIDKSAKVIMGPLSDKLYVTENGFIYQENSPYIYDANGNLAYILPSNIDGYSDNHWYKSNCTYYDETGKIMLEYSGSWTCHNFVNGMAFIQESGSFGEGDESGYSGHYIDTTGKKVIDHFETSNYENTIFDNSSSLPVYGLGGFWESFYFSENGTAVQKDSSGLLGYVNKSGVWTISPKFVKAGAFNKLGVAVVAIKNASDELVYGLINESGQYVLSPRYDLIWKFYSDYAVFRDDNGDLGFMNANGTVVINPNDNWTSANSFNSDGYARVKNQNGLWGIIDKNGNLVIDYKFSSLN